MDIMYIIVIALAVYAIGITILLIYILASMGGNSRKYPSNSYTHHHSSRYKDAVPRAQLNDTQKTSVIVTDIESNSQKSESEPSEWNTDNGLEDNINPAESDGSTEKKLSPKQQLRQQIKEKKALRKAEEAKRREQLAEEARKRNFNPKRSIPSGVKFSDLAVSGGHLVPCAIGQTPYYRCWEYEGTLYFEFYCDASKTPKALNNRSVILDPFCQKDNDSVSVDSAKTLTTLEYGVMDSNCNIISKSLVKFE